MVKVSKIQDIYFHVFWELRGEAKMEAGGNRNNWKERNEASERTSQGSLPSGSHGLRPWLYRHEGELLKTSQTKRENKCILEIS